jgi:ribosomal-protein-serine acetyltransferase
MFGVPLTTDTVLRVLEESDAELLFAHIDRDRMHLDPWLPFVERLTCVDHARRFIRFRLDQYARDKGPLAGIFVEGELVGGIGFHGIDHDARKTDLGYWLAPAAQGRGLATRAVAAMIDYAIGEQNVNRIEIIIDARNTRSRALPERLGFKLEGTLREAAWFRGQPIDHAVYAVLAREWKPPPSVV